MGKHMYPTVIRLPRAPKGYAIDRTRKPRPGEQDVLMLINLNWKPLGPYKRSNPPRAFAYPVTLPEKPAEGMHRYEVVDQTEAISDNTQTAIKSLATEFHTIHVLAAYGPPLTGQEDPTYVGPAITVKTPAGDIKYRARTFNYESSSRPVPEQK